MMLREKITLTRIGIMAGLIVMSSNAPDVIASIIEPEFARPSKVARDAMACVGNLLWVYYGRRSGALPITLFCSLAALMLGTLVSVQLWLRLPGVF